MLLDLGKIIAQPGSVLPFSTEMDFSQMELAVSYPASNPVRIEGTVRNEAGVLILNAAVDTTLHCICDRWRY